jgi:hypothetical protein
LLSTEILPNWKASSLQAFARDAARAEVSLDPAPAPATEERTTERADATSAAFNVQKVDPRRVGVASILKEVVELQTLTAPQLPEDLFSPYPRRACDVPSADRDDTPE